MNDVDDLRLSGEQYRELANLLPQVVFEMDIQGKLTYVNRFGFQLFGYSEQEFREGLNCLDMIAPEDRERAARNIRMIFQGSKTTGFEYNAIRKDGIRIPVIVYSSPIIRNGKPSGLRGILVDITENKKAEEALRKSAEFNRAVIEHSPIGVSVRSRTGTLISSNQSWKRIWAYTDDEVDIDFKKDRKELLFDEKDSYLDSWLPRVKEIYEKGGYVHIPECKVPDPRPGSARWVSQHFYSINDIEGNVEKVVILTNDVTESKEARQALSKSLEFQRALFEGCMDPILITDLDDIILSVNWSMISLFGWSEDELIGRKFPGHQGLDEGKFQEWLEKCRMGEGVTGYETIRTAKNGRVIPVSISISPIMNPERDLVSLSFWYRDISKRKKIEEERRLLENQLIQQQKLDSIATLASGVAHEINNPLMGMMNYAQLIDDRVQNEQLKDFSRGILKEGERVARIVRNLLAFGRKETANPKPSSLNRIVEDTLDLTSTLLTKDGISLETEIPSELPFILCKPQQIRQVLINIITNAADSLNSKYTGFNDDKVIRFIICVFEKEGDQWLRITIEDHGKGIPQNIQDRIFDPFFTTKDRAHGKGLGLSVSYGIIREHGGILTVESELDTYTRFHIDLPSN